MFTLTKYKYNTMQKEAYITSYNWPVNRQKSEQTETNLRGFGDLCGKEDNPMYFKAKYL